MHPPSSNFDAILDAGRRWKKRSHALRLVAPCTVEHEFKAKQFGHPSTYAFVRFECRPAEDLTFEMAAPWPPEHTADYCQLLHDAMSAAMVDVLVASEEPHTGCSLSCIEVRWDEVSSSERSFYHATRAAMIALLDREWRSAVLKP